MEIVNPCFCLLANFEVMECLRVTKATSMMKPGLKNLATVTYEALLYLENSPCKYQNQEIALPFVKKLKTKYKLTHDECLMMVNDPPLNALNIQLITENFEYRFTKAQTNGIVQLTRAFASLNRL